MFAIGKLASSPNTPIHDFDSLPEKEMSAKARIFPCRKWRHFCVDYQKMICEYKPHKKLSKSFDQNMSVKLGKRGRFGV